MPLDIKKEECMKYPSLKWFNEETGEYTNFKCNSWKCPVCKETRRKRLYALIKSNLEKENHIRLVTFTMRSSIFSNPKHCEEKLPNIWKYFLTYINRCPGIKFKTKNLRFIKVIEHHKSGYLHIHALFLDYIDWYIIQHCWASAINTVMNIQGKHGHVNIKHSLNAKNGAKYVVKYVIKAVAKMEKRIRIWSKSNNLEKTNTWIKENQGKWYLIRNAFLNLSINDVISQVLEQKNKLMLQNSIIESELTFLAASSRESQFFEITKTEEEAKNLILETIMW